MCSNLMCAPSHRGVLFRNKISAEEQLGLSLKEVGHVN